MKPKMPSMILTHPACRRASARAALGREGQQGPSDGVALLRVRHHWL